MVNTSTTATAYVSLGSNLGDRAGNLLLALRGMLNAGLEVTRLSQIYETEPVDTFPQPPFLNMIAALRISPATEPEDVMARLLQIEHSLGRTRDTLKGPRIIDLDLLLYGNHTCESDLLTLPHPRFHNRRFVLEPLAELCPDLEHPLFHQTITELLSETTDSSDVNLWRPKILD